MRGWRGVLVERFIKGAKGGKGGNRGGGKYTYGFTDAIFLLFGELVEIFP